MAQALTKKEMESFLKDKIAVVPDVLSGDLFSTYMTATACWKKYHGIHEGSNKSAVDILKSVFGKPTRTIFSDGHKYTAWGFKVDYLSLGHQPFIFLFSSRGTRIETVHEATFGHVKAFLESIVEKLMPDEKKRAEVAWKVPVSKLREIYKKIEDSNEKYKDSIASLYDSIEKKWDRNTPSNWNAILEVWDKLMEERTSPFALENIILTREVAKNRSREGKEVGATPMICTVIRMKDTKDDDHVSIQVNLKWIEQAKANEKVFRNVLNLLKRENNGIEETNFFDTGMDSSSSVDEIFKKYAKGGRFGVFTISDFTVKGGFAEIEYWNIAMMSGGGARHSFKISEDGTVKHDRCIATIVS